MGFDLSSAINDAGDVLESAAGKAEKTVGSAVQAAAHKGADVLDAVGLHQVADGLEALGAEAADRLGANVDEKNLGETADARELVHGDLGAIAETIGHLGNFADGFDEAAAALGAIDAGHWVGAGATAFHQEFNQHPRQWTNAADAMSSAEDALVDYHSILAWAQQQAGEAIAKYREGVAASNTARTHYNSQIDQYNAQAAAYNATARQARGAMPTQPGAFVDPGVEIVAQARALLTSARQQRTTASAEASAALAAATELAPTKPSFLTRLGNDVQDVHAAAVVGAEHVLGGALTGTAELAKTVRSLNPQDPYNMTHPAAYTAGLGNFGAGLVHGVTHPMSLVKSMVGSGWGSDPAEALGKLIPQVVAAAATDGGSAAGAGLKVAESTAVRAAERAAAREAIPETRVAARPPEAVKPHGDPVDVATGAVVLTQVDLQCDGLLPLRLARSHISSYRAGRWFGATWCSTFDQRVEVDAAGVVVITEDGMLLQYPHPRVDAPVLPEEGPRWPLSRTEQGGYRLEDPRSGRQWHFHPSVSSSEIALTAITDRNRNRILFRYNAFGEPVEVVHSGGYRVAVETVAGRITELRMGEVVLTRYGYTGDVLTEVFNSSPLPLQFGYDAEQRLTRWIDRTGTRYDYTYDEAGRCVYQVGSDGVMENWFQYRTSGWGAVTAATDSLGATTEYRISPACQVVAVTDPLGRTTSLSYDRYDRLLERTDPLGQTTRYGYDEHGDLTTLARPDGERVMVEYAGAGLPSRAYQPDGTVWAFSYDELGNPVATEAPDATSTSAQRDVRGAVTAFVDELGNRTVIEADAAGLPLAVIDPVGAITRFERDSFCRVRRVVSPEGEVTELAWTVEGRLARWVGPDGAVQSWVYDGEGNQIEHVDAVGAVTRTEYTHFDVPSVQIRPDGSRIEFGYDPQLRLTSVTNPQGLRWSYEHDVAGQLVSESDFDGRVLTYTYDAAGRLSSTVNGAGESIRYSYDALDNVVGEVSTQGVTRYAHDRLGRVVAAMSPDTELWFERDVMGRIAAEVCDGRRLESVFDAAGQRVGRRTPAGVQTAWQFDGRGLVNEVLTDGHRLGSLRDGVGRETRRSLAPGLSVEQRWAAGRLAGQSVVAGRSALNLGGSAGSGRVLQERSYAYRADGALVGVADRLRGDRAFALDARGQVTAVTGGGWAESYAYDTSGNLAAAVVPQEVGGPQEQGGGREYRGTLLQRAGRSRFRYDAQGRLVGKTVARLSRKPETWAYEWDAHDRLRAVVTPDGVRWRYRYDAFGRRVAKQQVDDDGVVVSEVRFSWDGDRIAEQVSVAGEAAGEVLTWVYDGFAPVSQSRRTVIDQGAVDAEFFAIATDLVGTPTELIDPEAGAVAGHAATSLWGQSVWSGAATPLRFPGQYFDDESGLHYNRYRYYAPDTARYLSLDPLGLAPSPNPSAYPHNPTAWTDPLGLAPCRPGQGTKIRYGPHTPGPLKEDIANTFRSSSYTATTSDGATTLYRVYGGQAGEMGPYWSKSRPSGPLQSQLDSALNPGWGNSATKVVEIRLPAGVTYYEGAAAEQPIAGGGVLSGGGNQVYVPRVDPKWVVK
jgi:RHS repeat-associated protein